VTVTAGVVEPRYPSFKGLAAAKSKPVEELTVVELGLDPSQSVFSGAAAGDLGKAVKAREAGEIVVDAGEVMSA